MGRRRRSKAPRYTGPSPEEAAAEATRRAEEAAAKVRQENEAKMREMEAKAEAMRKKHEATVKASQTGKYQGSTIGSQQEGLSRKKTKAKEKRKFHTKDTRIALDPTKGPTGAGEVNV